MSTNHTIMSANQPVTSTSTSETETTLNSAITPHSIPINQEILSNPNLFLKHISDVDQDLLHFPNPSPPSINTQNPSTKIHISDSKPSFYPPKSTNPQKECPTLKLSHSTKNPNMLGAQILIKNPTILNTMNTLGLQPHTWKRLTPINRAMNTNEDSGSCMGQKRKCKTH